VNEEPFTVIVTCMEVPPLLVVDASE